MPQKLPPWPLRLNDQPGAPVGLQNHHLRSPSDQLPSTPPPLPPPPPPLPQQSSAAEPYAWRRVAASQTAATVEDCTAIDDNRRDSVFTVAATATVAVVVDSPTPTPSPTLPPRPTTTTPSSPTSPSQPSPTSRSTPSPERHEHRNSSTNSYGKHKRMNTVDFVLAYKRRRKSPVREEDDKQERDDETKRRRFFRELRTQGVLVNVDDDPACSLDAGRTCFALLRLSRRILMCKCRCHIVNNDSENNIENEQTVAKDNDRQQYLNNNGNYQMRDEKLTSAQRAQIVWRIILRIGSDNKQNLNVMSLDQLLDANIITAAYPVHDGNFKLDERKNPNDTNDRWVLYENWARPGQILPRQWKSDEKITALIRQYYGLPVAVYFRWLRYYTIWLVGPAIIGLLWFLYGLMTTHNDVPTRDICDPRSKVANWILCPTRRCDANFCGFTRVLDTCGIYRWTSAATFDRPGAVVFAVFMSFWAMAFQQLWTIYGWPPDEHCESLYNDNGRCIVCCSKPSGNNAPVAAQSNIPPLDQQPPLAAGERPRSTTATTDECLHRPTTAAVRPPSSPIFSLHVLRRWYVGATAVVFRVFVFLATLITAAAIPVLIVVYRGRAIGWLMFAVFHQEGEQQENALRHQSAAEQQHRQHNFFLLNYTNSGELSNWKTAVAALCATFVQLTAIVAVHHGYSAVAMWLTKYSYRSVFDPRFQSYYTAYMSCFDSVNYYSSLVYIAFFKGRYATGNEPYTDNTAKLSNFWPIYLIRSLMYHVREDVCDPAAAGTGCVPELCIQLAIIMVGKQIVDNVIELTMPLTLNVWRRWRAKENRRRKTLKTELPDTIIETLRHSKQWQLDYQLEDTGPLGLYQEYSEMVIQYGFVVMFTTAFPLAPLCALLNNILEQQLDAYKMVAAQRRPVPSYYCTNSRIFSAQKSSCCNNCINLGTWTRVLKVLSVISVLYNTFMIAFTSDLLPRYVYSSITSETSSSSLEGYVAWSLSSKRNMSEYYYGAMIENIDSPEICRFRGYGGDANDSELDDYGQWQVLAARLTFVIAFEHFVILAIAILAYLIRKIVTKYKNLINKSLNPNKPNNKNDNNEKSPKDSLIITDPNTSTAIIINSNQPTVDSENMTNNKADQMIFENGQSISEDCPTSSTMVVVDIENDDQEQRKSKVPLRRRQSEKFKNSLNFSVT